MYYSEYNDCGLDAYELAPFSDSAEVTSADVVDFYREGCWRGLVVEDDADIIHERLWEDGLVINDAEDIEDEEEYLKASIGVTTREELIKAVESTGLVFGKEWIFDADDLDPDLYDEIYQYLEEAYNEPYSDFNTPDDFYRYLY